MLQVVMLCLALAALLGVHLWWRARFRRSQALAQREIQRLQQAQEQSAVQFQAQQETLFNSMAEGLLLLDEKGRIQLANRAAQEMFGLSADVRSRSLMEALRLHALAEMVSALDTQKQILGYELEVSRPRQRLVQVNGAALLDSAGRRHGTLLVFHDLTRLKQLERVRQEFVANVSHELRTPLSLIKGYVETLLDGAKDNPEVAAKFLQTIARNTERLAVLLDDLLTIAELESGRLTLKLQAVAFRELADKVLVDFKTRAEAKRAQLINLSPELCVRADADRLEQVLSNLVDNALKYGRAEGRVRIDARALAGGRLEVSVQDDGPGIPAELLERVFERFYRVDKARSREQGGTGLGLSIVKHIIQSHGGEVWARSQPGQGATFFFTLAQAGPGFGDT